MYGILKGVPMIIPNWQHHSRKDASRTLKPQAMRDAKRRTKALKYKLNVHNHAARRQP